MSATFRGPGIPDTFRTDVITLDSVAPTVARSVLVTAARGWYVGVRTRDDGTGIGRVGLLDKNKQPVTQRLLCARARCSNQVRLRFVSGKKPAYVTSRDAAGNQTVTRLRRARTTCAAPAYMVPRKAPRHDELDCFTLNDTVSQKAKRKYDWKVAGLRVRNLDGRLRVTKR